MQSYPSSRASSRVRPANGTNGMSISTSPHNRINPTDSEATPVGEEAHPAIHVGRTALVTGAASGIGLALSKELANLGLRVVLVDINESDLKHAESEISGIIGAPNVMAIKADVSNYDEVIKLRDHVFDQYGEVNLLFNNAGVALLGGVLSDMDNWRRLMDVNMFGVLNMLQAFTPLMVHQENPSLIVNTGSKQGITNPPGNAGYNASKAAVRVITENLAHELRTAGAHVTSHLFVPGWTFTKMTGAETADGLGEKRDGAWTAEETVRYMLRKVRDGKFYIICPDNETSEDLDRLRIKWAAGDIVEGRPALSRWHPEWQLAFEEYVSSGLNHFDQRRIEKERYYTKTPSLQEDNL